MQGSLGEKIGEGAFADVHAWAPGQVVKLFKASVRQRTRSHEARMDPRRLRCRRPDAGGARRGNAGGALRADSPSRPSALKRCTQSRNVCRSIPASSAAIARG